MNTPINKNLRLILAARTAGLPETLKTTQFLPMEHDDILKMFEDAGLWFGPRPVLEETEEFRQIIPYIVLKLGDRYLRYTRTPAGEEARLHGRVSIGLGGHVDLGDSEAFNEQVDLDATLDNAAARELEEELGGVNVMNQRWVGVLAENQSPVGRVHIGIIGVWELDADYSFRGNSAEKAAEIHRLLTGQVEEALGEVSLATLADLRAAGDRLEPWSAMLLDFLDQPTEVDAE